ncbi:hypothetical protein LOAG_00491 [Loa loa]|uniref:Uncharacterized protein n=1 Tax=Loa loa TaxID=7209 RepID=A0A1S0UBK3_LOALO|nr:hypothetical protein LOAG_00491 [Loa loa]EFO27983.2 hypothetical protein LOAG_00491 [Loa loa]
MFIVLLVVTMKSFGWFNTTATATATMMALATSSHANPDVINALSIDNNGHLKDRINDKNKITVIFDMHLHFNEIENIARMY